MIDRNARDPDRRAEQRQRHVAEDLPARGAVDQRRLLELARDLLQPGEVEDHVEAEVLPRDRDEQRVEDDARGRPATARSTGITLSTSPPGWSISVNTTPVTTSESTNGAKYRTRSSARPWMPRVQQQRDAERERQLERERQHDEDAVVLQRADEHLVAERALEVLQPDEVVQRPEPAPVEGAEVHRLQHRGDDQQPVQHQRRREEQPDGGPTAPGARAARPANRRREDENRVAIRPWPHPRSCRRRPAGTPCPRTAPGPRR